MGPLPTDDAAEYWKAAHDAADEIVCSMRDTIVRLETENTTLRARLETVEAETRERCVRELSLRRLALDHQTEVLDIAREMDIYDICIDAIRSMGPHHD